MKQRAVVTCAWLGMALSMACGGRGTSGKEQEQEQEQDQEQDQGGAGGDSSQGPSVAPEPVLLGHCQDRVGYPTFPLDPAVRESVEGTNGTFVEACDADGNLITYQCEMRTLCGGDIDCAPYPTGKVGPSTYPCPGGCADGVCLAP